MADLIPYKKPYQTATQLCQKLRDQGLEIPEQLSAEKALNRISYYRLKAYFLPFQNSETKRFHSGTSFEDCYLLYHFDSELRNYFFSVIEKVEIGVRSLFDQWMTKETGNPFWYLDSSLFASNGEQIETISKLRGMFKASKEEFARHFQSKYYNEYCPFYRELPPGWVAIELMTFGNLVKLMSNVCEKQYDSLKLNRFTKKNLSVEKYKSLCSWMKTIHEVRNNCGHHSRLFNRNLAAPTAIKRILQPQAAPLVKTKPSPDKHEVDQVNRLYTAAAALQQLLIGLGYDEKMGPVISALFDKYPIALRFKPSMGFPENWREEPLFFS
ncbi:Abi family protein [Oceanospirillum maris]|uniref:Abi family protein n=1 Tax=Oceanospirillum maris TaxID=64977 RepID=UPI0003F97724|nr:Abi family protein [Oceanospirillum maris]